MSKQLLKLCAHTFACSYTTRPCRCSLNVRTGFGTSSSSFKRAENAFESVFTEAPMTYVCVRMSVYMCACDIACIVSRFPIHKLLLPSLVHSCQGIHKWVPRAISAHPVHATQTIRTPLCFMCGCHCLSSPRRGAHVLLSKRTNYLPA